MSHRVGYIAGIGLTYLSEHEKMEKRFLEQHPELTDAQRNARVTETATVRTGAQLLTSAWAAAMAGSVIPVGGTLVGLAVGLVVGLAMSIPTGDGKTLGDNAADAGEAVWNGIKDIGNWAKGLFGG